MKHLHVHEVVTAVHQGTNGGSVLQTSRPHFAIPSRRFSPPMDQVQQSHLQETISLVCGSRYTQQSSAKLDLSLAEAVLAR